MRLWSWWALLSRNVWPFFFLLNIVFLPPTFIICLQTIQFYIGLSCSPVVFLRCWVCLACKKSGSLTVFKGKASYAACWEDCVAHTLAKHYFRPTSSPSLDYRFDCFAPTMAVLASWRQRQGDDLRAQNSAVILEWTKCRSPSCWPKVSAWLKPHTLQLVLLIAGPFGILLHPPIQID